MGNFIFTRRRTAIALSRVSTLLLAFVATSAIGAAGAAENGVTVSVGRKLNNLVSELVEISSVSGPSNYFTFRRATDGWIFISLSCQGNGTAKLILDKQGRADIVLEHESAARADQRARHEAAGRCKYRGLGVTVAVLVAQLDRLIPRVSSGRKQ